MKSRSLDPDAQVRVSVCLAAYNGQQFIGEQVRSILRQLGPSDELIVCDDCSLDGTMSILTSIDDARLIVHSFCTNVGHVRNFERAITKANGDLIFLSDQDDIWHPEKYRVMVECFQRNPDVQLVHHALSTIDTNGNLCSILYNPLPSGRQKRFKYLISQLIRCQIFGCATAFRRTLMVAILPFPTLTYAHDHWLAIVSGICGQVFFINQPLVLYRQHNGNLTPRNGFNLRKKIALRIRFFAMMAVAFFRFVRIRFLGGRSCAAIH